MSEFEPAGIVTLLTDFGLRDTYVGQMKGVLLSIDQTLQIVDLTHQIAPQDIGEGAFQLASAVGAFPDGCVHVAVVDPGVGTERRAIVAQTPSRVFVAPDNGLLTLVHDHPISVYEIADDTIPRTEVSATFHGRDLFAPVAGLIAAGKLSPESVGPPVDPGTLVTLPVDVRRESGQVSGTVVAIDHFGNAITLIDSSMLPERAGRILVSSGPFQVEGLVRTYAEVGPGEALALIGSAGTLELSVREGSAAREFGLSRGDVVVVRFEEGVRRGP